MIHGYLHPDFADVAVALRSTLRHKRGGGAAAAVYHRGEKVVDIWSGTRDDDRSPWEEDTVAMSWSTSKGVVATAAHRLVDRGELDVDAPVAEYWPEFKAAGKEDVRVANLLDHSAGMHSVRGVIDDADMLFEWDRTDRRARGRGAEVPARHQARLPRAHLRLPRRRGAAARHRPARR